MSKVAAFQIDKNTKQVGTQNGFTLTDNGNRVYSPANKPTAEDVGAIGTTGGFMTGTLETKSIVEPFNGGHVEAGDSLNTLFSKNRGGWGYTTNGLANPNNFPTNSNANGLLTFNTHAGDYGHQIGMSSNGALYSRHNFGGSITDWGKIYSEHAKPTAGEIGAAEIGHAHYEYAPTSHTHSDYALKGTTVNGMPLSGNITLRATDVKARPDTWMPTAAEVGAFSKTGGTITGPVTIASGGGKMTFNTTSNSVFFGNDNSGWFLYLNNDGTLKWDGYQVYHQGFKPTAADVGALSTTGGTVTGMLTANQVRLDSDNGRGIASLQTPSGSWKTAILAQSDTNLVVGHPNNWDTVTIEGKDLHFNNGTRYKVYHEGNKPTPADIGARPDTWLPTKEELGITSDVTSVNGKKGDVTLNAADVKARPNTWMPTATQIGAVSEASLVGTSIGKFKQLDTEVDFDTLITPGVYEIRFIAHPTDHNSPYQSPGVLTVYKVGGFGNFVQEFRPLTGNNTTYVRKKYNGWSKWAMAYNTQHKPTFYDIETTNSVTKEVETLDSVISLMKEEIHFLKEEVKQLRIQVNKEA